MSWHLRSPQSFPAHFGRIIREAVAMEGRPVLFHSTRSRDDARSRANDFRHYRWCLRQQPGIEPGLTLLESIYDFRLRSEDSYHNVEHWIITYLTAQPTKLSQFVNLNPHLADIVSLTAMEGVASGDTI